MWILTQLVELTAVLVVATVIVCIPLYIVCLWLQIRDKADIAKRAHDEQTKRWLQSRG